MVIRSSVIVTLHLPLELNSIAIVVIILRRALVLRWLLPLFPGLLDDGLHLVALFCLQAPR
jgi:hypothetical protein